MYYKLSEYPTDSELIKTSVSSSKIYKLATISSSSIEPNRVEIYVQKPGERVVKLDGLFNPNRKC
jgi:hypothetical protein